MDAHCCLWEEAEKYASSMAMHGSAYKRNIFTGKIRCISRRYQNKYFRHLADPHWHIMRYFILLWPCSLSVFFSSPSALLLFSAVAGSDIFGCFLGELLSHIFDMDERANVGDAGFTGCTKLSHSSIFSPVFFLSLISDMSFAAKTKNDFTLMTI